MQCIASYAGTWEQDGESWKYKKDNGSYAEYEWVQDNGDWYYCSRWGLMEKNTVIDGYYVGADGKMLSQDDKANPLYGEKVYGTCYMGAVSYTHLPGQSVWHEAGRTGEQACRTDTGDTGGCH